MDAAETEANQPQAAARPRKLSSRLNILIRRIHLYAGLFLLPWVLLYGVTGAMFNHQELFPEATIRDVPAALLAESPLKELPTPEELAQEVVAQLQAKSPQDEITLATEHGAEFTNNVILEVNGADTQYFVHVDPITRSARVVEPPEKEELHRLLGDVREIQLNENPYELVRQAVPEILSAAGVEANHSPRPRGWCKLNFLAQVNGEPARVTYVLRDGHVDVTRFDGKDGMTPRHFFLRLHTSHGQPPHWNHRMLWSLIVDAMAVAMVVWCLSGLVMWWQVKRTRMIGAAVIVASAGAATAIFLGMQGFYAATKL